MAAVHSESACYWVFSSSFIHSGEGEADSSFIIASHILLRFYSYSRLTHSETWGEMRREFSMRFSQFSKLPGGFLSPPFPPSSLLRAPGILLHDISSLSPFPLSLKLLFCSLSHTLLQWHMLTHWLRSVRTACVNVRCVCVCVGVRALQKFFPVVRAL